jgi:PAS domain S-box-containing protein
MQSLAEAVIATDERGRIRLFNRIAEKLTGWASAEATDISIDEILAVVDERTGTPMESLVRKAVELREALSVAEGTSIVSRSGKTVAVEESASPIVDARGNVLGGVLVLRDVSERRHQLLEIQKLNSELERRVLERTAALEAANRELESFSYSVAHDLRAPLRGIDGFSELLLVECGKQLDPHAVGYVNRVRKAAARMSELIDALLSLAHIGRTNLDARDLDFTQLVDGIAQELAAADPERCVGIRIEPGMRVRADPKLLRLAIGNLLDNAWKFTGRRAEACIDVGARRDVRTSISCATTARDSIRHTPSGCSALSSDCTRKPSSLGPASGSRSSSV